VELLEEKSIQRVKGGTSSRMEAKLTFKFDREAHILHIDKCPPYAEQESKELGGGVVARPKPVMGEIENLERECGSAGLAFQPCGFSTKPWKGRGSGPALRAAQRHAPVVRCGGPADRC
jgi:hypothetical protein